MAKKTIKLNELLSYMCNNREKSFDEAFYTVWLDSTDYLTYKKNKKE